jgi:protein translocase SecG subunit
MDLISQIKPFLIPAQIVVAALLILLVLLQPRGDALGSAFGQTFLGAGRLRGAAKKIFGLTLGLGLAFILLAVANLFL